MTDLFGGLSTPIVIGGLVALALVIGWAGTRMTTLADKIADRTGLGEAITGGVLLGAATSLSGTVVSVTAALSGDASLAFSNAIGGIAAQTVFLAVADLLHRRANLEHAGAEQEHMLQASFLMLLLSLPLFALGTPDTAIFAIHPVSAVLVVVYIVSVITTARIKEDPSWVAVTSPERREDEPEDEEEARRPIGPLIPEALILLAVLGGTGWLLANLAAVLIERFSLSSSFVGAAMTATITSLPELVTTIAAVRRGALQLAIGGIIGGNTFDVLFLTISDAAYRDGSIYAAIGPGDLFWLATGLVMTAILLTGLLVREKAGPGRIGTESVALFAVYLAALGIQAWG